MHPPHKSDVEPVEDEKQNRIHVEEIKQRHVSHWDLDYIPTDEIDAAFAEGNEKL